MESISPIVQKEKSRKQLAEERRNNAFNAAVGDIKEELIQRGYGQEEDLGSQPAILMLVAETLNQVDLKSKYPAEARRKSEGGKMPKDMEKVVKANREQMRRNKINSAIDSIREFIIRNELGDRNSKRLEKLDVVNTILDYIRTLPSNNAVTSAPVGQVNAQTVAPTSPTSSSHSPTLSPGLPTLSPSPPLLQQVPVVAQQSIGLLTPGLPNLLPTGSPLPLPMAPMFPWMTTPFPMVPMDPATIQFRIQFWQNRMIIQNFINQNQESQVKKEEVAQPAEEEPTVAPIKDEDEDLNLIN
ncbi:hypothetical protein CRE_02858 [Caenorhabditis remanei]|uniref:BHLH domain-containing protein n=1 Tax=Caenorhabditis remanei TaxID=31234 RepID=E3LW97_CAERE|nr:hypothetical protein CRE_02858 [Caenorhabditis remanei]